MSDVYDPGFDEAVHEPPRRSRIRYDPTATRGGDAFRDAQRHSRWVRWLKYVLPALALIAAGVFWASARIIPSEYADLVEVSGIDIESNSVVMNEPHISGFEGTRRAYDVRAASAVQSLSDPKVITFNEIEASIGLEDAGTATINAQVGVFDGNRNHLSLEHGITIQTTEGYAARFNAVEIDIDAGGLVSEQPLEVRSVNGTLRANSVVVEERGKRVSFTNGVAVTFTPDGDLMVPGGSQ